VFCNVVVYKSELTMVWYCRNLITVVIIVVVVIIIIIIIPVL